MKTMGIDYSGRPWWIESDIEIEVKKCPACGNPVAIINTSETETVEKIVFHKQGPLPKSLAKLGEFKVEELKGEAKLLPKPCPWCGFIDSV
jgi:hypothetical protein